MLLRTSGGMAVVVMLATAGATAAAWALWARLERRPSPDQSAQCAAPASAGRAPPAAAATEPLLQPPGAAADANAALVSTYEHLAKEFDAHGLDPAATQDIQRYFDHTDPAIATLPWARAYDVLDPPRQPGTVRLLVAPLAANEPAAATLAARAAAACLRVLPPGLKVFSNSAADYHITLFQLSQFMDTRPDTLDPSGGDGAGAPLGVRPAPSPSQRDAELAAARDVVGASPALQLRLHSVVLARSGTLLLTWEDSLGTVTGLRRRLRERFPGASPKQPFTVHTTLWRIVGPAGARLERAAVQAVAQEAQRLTKQLRGRPFSAGELWHVTELEFSTIRGIREPMPAAANAS